MQLNVEKVVDCLELIFRKKSRVEGKFIKLNVESLSGSDVYLLNGFNLKRFEGIVKDFTVKRSGTGLVIIIELI